MEDIAELRAALEAAVGDGHVTTSESELERHGHDESWHATARPDLVVFPATTEEVATVVRACHARRVPMVPFGAGSSLEGNVAALEGGVSIDLTRMDRIVAVRPEDLDVTVEAGVTRRQLETRLREDCVFFSVDPGADATFGGMAATGASGTTAVRYGTMRENVLSLTVVRMVPVAISLIGSRLQLPTWIFLGWFGPRGLASILFALLVLGERQSQLASELMATVAATVLLSVLLHGITAAPAARWYGRAVQRMGDSEEAGAVQEMRPRFRGD